jgi:hypothetical protein
MVGPHVILTSITRMGRLESVSPSVQSAVRLCTSNPILLYHATIISLPCLALPLPSLPSTPRARIRTCHFQRPICSPPEIGSRHTPSTIHPVSANSGPHHNLGRVTARQCSAARGEARERDDYTSTPTHHACLKARGSINNAKHSQFQQRNKP